MKCHSLFIRTHSTLIELIMTVLYLTIAHKRLYLSDLDRLGEFSNLTQLCLHSKACLGIHCLLGCLRCVSVINQFCENRDPILTKVIFILRIDQEVPTLRPVFHKVRLALGGHGCREPTVWILDEIIGFTCSCRGTDKVLDGTH